MRKLWHHLPFAGRLLVTASIALLIAGLVMVGVAARQDAADTQRDLQQTLAQELGTLPNTLAEVVLIGDFATLQQTLDSYVARPLIIEARFADIKGSTLVSRDNAYAGVAPEWFLSLFDYQNLQGYTRISVGGYEYGQFHLTLSPRRLADRVWLRLLQHMAILLLAVIIDFIGIWLVLRFGLRPLKQLEQATAAMAAGRLDTRLEVTGSPELRHLIESFNTMAKAIQSGAENLRQSEERLQLAINGVNDGIWDWNLHTNEIYFSPKWQEMIGYADKELVGHLETFRTLLHPDDAPLVFHAIEDYLSGVSPIFAVEFRFRHKDGSWKWILGRGTAVRDVQGHPYRMAGSHTDITERKRYEEALATERRRFNDILRGTNAGTWEWNVQTGETLFNERWAEIIGYTLAELAPLSIETWMRFAHPDDLKGSADLLAQHFAGTLDYYDCEARMRHKDGHWVWVLDRGKLVSRTADGKPLLMSGSRLDISAHKQAEQELIQARQAAEAANQAKSAFLANMNHELRTPLNAILGFAQILRQSPTLATDQRTQVESIYRGGEYLLTLINDILDLAKIEAGRIELFPEEINVNNFFQELKLMFRQRAKQKSIAFEYQAEPPLPFSIQADPTRLRQVLVNLIGNAVKFTEHGGVRLQVTYRNAQLQIAVHDSGPGIDPTQHTEIFKPFSQTGESRYKAQGTGLGLSITHKIIELMGGTLTLHSEVGQGSCFQVAVPLPANFATPTEAPSASTSQKAMSGYIRLVSGGAEKTDNPHPYKILLVDDVADNRTVLRQLLQPLGFECAEADNGETALQLAPQFQPDLVLMDLRMPGLDGQETTRRLHILPAFDQLPIIAVSASAYQEDHSTAHDAGCVDYLTKPVAFTTLLQALQTHLSLEWTYRAEQEQSPTPSGPPLSTAQRSKLIALVQDGSITELYDYLTALAAQPDCPADVTNLQELAQNFQLNEIQRYLEQQP